MTCPYCHRRLLDSIVVSEAARITRRAAVKAGVRAGRKPVMTHCMLCQTPFNSSEMREHLPQCTRRAEKMHMAFMCPRCGKMHSAREMRRCKV